MAAATSAFDSSGCNGHVLRPSHQRSTALDLASTFGGEAPIDDGHGTHRGGAALCSAFTRTALPSLEETASCAAAPNDHNGRVKSATTRPPLRGMQDS